MDRAGPTWSVGDNHGRVQDPMGICGQHSCMREITNRYGHSREQYVQCGEDLSNKCGEDLASESEAGGICEMISLTDVINVPAVC